MTSLYESLFRAEQQFLLANFSCDEGALENFFQEWSRLLGRTKSVQAKGQLDSKTALLFSRVSRAIECIHDCMLQSEAIMQDAHSHIINELNRELPLDSLHAPSYAPSNVPPHLLFSHRKPSANLVTLGHHAALDTHAHRWLIQNIHNPYPSPMQLQTLGDISNASMAQVELWFQEARDMIEWTRISHGFFAGSPDATVSAAKRVYLENDKDIPFDIVFAFTVVKAFADTLFSKRPVVQEESLCVDWVKSFQCSAERQRRYPQPFDGSKTSLKDTPTLRADSLTLQDGFSDLTDSDEGDEGEEEDITPPPPTAGLKRRHTEAGLTSQSVELERDPKRYRIWSAAEISKLEWTSRSSAIPVASEEEAATTGAQTWQTPLTLTLPPPTSLSPNSKSSSPTLLPRKRRRAETDENTPEEAAKTHSNLAPYKRRVLEDAVIVSDKQRSLSSTIGPVDFAVPRPTQVSINPDTPVSVGVVDWNTIPNSSVETAASMPQPASLYLSGSELMNVNPNSPDPQGLRHCTKDRQYPPSFDELCSLEDFNALLQFVSTSPSDPLTVPSPSRSLETSFFPLQDNDFVERRPPVSTPSTPKYPPMTVASVTGTPDIVTSSSSPLTFSHGTAQPTSLLDLSTPPSSVLPQQPGAFTGDEYDIWSWPCSGS